MENNYPIRIKTEVVEFTLNKSSRARRNAPAIKAGTTLYAIKYELGGYFTYSYKDKQKAEECRQTQIDNQTNTFQFYGFNVVDDLNDTMPVSK